MERLQDALSDPEIRDEAVEALRSLLEAVIIAPTEAGLEIEIIGDIAHMIEMGIEDKKKRPALNEKTVRSVKVVAGVGFEPSTFRL